MAINIPECLRPKSKGSAVRIIGTFGESLLKAQPNNPAIRTNDIDKRESGGGGVIQITLLKCPIHSRATLVEHFLDSVRPAAHLVHSPKLWGEGMGCTYKGFQQIS